MSAVGNSLKRKEPASPVEPRPGTAKTTNFRADAIALIGEAAAAAGVAALPHPMPPAPPAREVIDLSASPIPDAAPSPKPNGSTKLNIRQKADGRNAFREQIAKLVSETRGDHEALKNGLEALAQQTHPQVLEFWLKCESNEGRVKTIIAEWVAKTAPDVSLLLNPEGSTSLNPKQMLEGRAALRGLIAKLISETGGDHDALKNGLHDLAERTRRQIVGFWLNSAEGPTKSILAEWLAETDPAAPAVAAASASASASGAAAAAAMPPPPPRAPRAAPASAAPSQRLPSDSFQSGPAAPSRVAAPAASASASAAAAAADAEPMLPPSPELNLSSEEAEVVATAFGMQSVALGPDTLASSLPALLKGTSAEVIRRWASIWRSIPSRAKIMKFIQAHRPDCFSSDDTLRTTQLVSAAAAAAPAKETITFMQVDASFDFSCLPPKIREVAREELARLRR